MTAIKHNESFSAKDNVILVGTAKTDFSKYGLTPAELAYVKKQITAEEHIINVNQYERRVVVYIEDKRKEGFQTLEACRKAGNKVSGVMNAAKAESVTILDLTGNVENILAFAEGMALGNYQFLHYRQDIKKAANALKTINISSKKVKAAEVKAVKNDSKNNSSSGSQNSADEKSWCANGDRVHAGKCSRGLFKCVVTGSVVRTRGQRACNFRIHYEVVLSTTTSREGRNDGISSRRRSVDGGYTTLIATRRDYWTGTAKGESVTRCSVGRIGDTDKWLGIVTRHANHIN